MVLGKAWSGSSELDRIDWKRVKKEQGKEMQMMMMMMMRKQKWLIITIQDHHEIRREGVNHEAR